MKKTALITGISSQDGAYLAKLLLEKDYCVVGTVRDLQNNFISKLQYLGIHGQVQYELCDLLNMADLSDLVQKVKPDEIYNLAAQSSVSLSFQQPYDTIHFNSISVLNLLEIVKRSHAQIKLLQAVSSDIYGGKNDLPITENSAIVPKSPYAVSKALAYWTVKNYRETYSLFCANAILFNHESYLRGNDFFVKKIIKNAVKIKNNELDILKLGNIDVKRDFGYAPEYVKAMWLMLQAENADDYCICSGMPVSLRAIVEYVFNKLDISLDKIVIDNSLFRPNDVPEIYGDNSKIKKNLNWQYNVSFFTTLDMLLNEELSVRSIAI